MRIYVSHDQGIDAGVLVRLDDRLTQAFGPGSVVRINRLAAPPEALEHLTRAAMTGADVIVAVLDSASLARPDERDAVLLREIDAALRQDVPTVPVLVDCEDLPPRSDLPAALLALFDRQVIHVRSSRPEPGLDRLVDVLRAIEAGTVPSVPDIGLSDACQADLDEVGAATAESPRDEAVQFSVFKPWGVPLVQWTKLLAFMHLADAAPGAPEPLDQVQAEARRRLGPEADDYRQTTQDAALEIPRESEISFVPRVEGVRFNPPMRRFEWAEDLTYHAEEFDIRPEGEPGNRRGALQVFMGVLLIAEIPLVLTVTTDAPERAEEPERVSANPYRRIFVSYSRRDVDVVEQVERLAVLGDDYLRDLTSIRPGQRWTGELERLITEADIFQLFWSTNSCQSDWVRREYLYALELGRPLFIRGTYWEDPYPDPPEELSDVHFGPLAIGAPLQAPPPAAGAPPQPARAQTCEPVDQAMLSEEDTDQAMLSTPSFESHGPPMRSGPIHVGGGGGGRPDSGPRMPSPATRGAPPPSGGGHLVAAIGCVVVAGLVALVVWWLFF